MIPPDVPEFGKFIKGAWIPDPETVEWPISVACFRVPAPTMNIMIGDLPTLASEYGIDHVDHCMNTVPRILIAHWSGDYDLTELVIAGLQELHEIRRRLRMLGCR